jgi:hypothetical protein
MMNELVGKTRMEINTPRRFSARAILLLNGAGLLLLLPVVASFAVASFFGLGVMTYVIPLATALVALFFLPLGFGNPAIVRWVRSGQPARTGRGMAVQLTLEPRLRSGFQAMLEDADDIGWLSVTAEGIRFEGDSIMLVIPREQVATVRRRTVGWRGLFLYGARIEITAKDSGDWRAFVFGERESKFLPQSRNKSRELTRWFKELL